MEVFKASVFFQEKMSCIFLVAGQFLVGTERIWTRCQYLFAVRFYISDSVDKILNQKSFSKLWVTWPFMERVLHSGSLAPHKRTNCSVFTNVSNSILWIDCIGKGPIKPGGQNWTQNWGDFQPMAAYWGESVANMTNVLHDIFAVCYQPYLYQ